MVLTVLNVVDQLCNSKETPLRVLNIGYVVKGLVNFGINLVVI